MVNATRDVLFSIPVLFLAVCVRDMILDPHKLFHSIAMQVRFCLIALFYDVISKQRYLPLLVPHFGAYLFCLKI